MNVTVTHNNTPISATVTHGTVNIPVSVSTGHTQVVEVAKGVQGAKGDKGDKGDTGAQGVPGINGINGSDGADGATGAKGDKGDKGDTGATGAKGDKGDKGDTGATGGKGDKGDKGDAGEQGLQGEAGAQGIQGEKGDKGDKGDTGDPPPNCVTNPNTAAENRLATFDGATGKEIKQGIFFDLPSIVIPAAPAADTLRFFSRRRAGKMLPMIIDPEGIDQMMQTALFGATVAMWLPTTGTTISPFFGSGWTARNAGTGAAQSHPTLVAGDGLQAVSRARFGTGTTSTGTSGVVGTTPLFWRGNATGRGGFFSFFRFGVEAVQSDTRLFVGLGSNNATLGTDPSTRNDIIGLCKDAADTEWQITTRGNTGGPTKTTTGLSVTNNQVLDLFIGCDANSNKMSLRLLDAVTRTPIVDGVDITDTLPRNNVFLAPMILIQAQSGTANQFISPNRIYVQTEI